MLLGDLFIEKLGIKTREQAVARILPQKFVDILFFEHIYILEHRNSYMFLLADREPLLTQHSFVHILEIKLNKSLQILPRFTGFHLILQLIGLVHKTHTREILTTHKLNKVPSKNQLVIEEQAH